MKRFTVNKKYGYYEAVQKPTEQELSDYYEEKYYQDEHATYARNYEDQELEYFKNKIAQKDFVVRQILGRKHGSLLDIGCGEGFTLNYYYQQGWHITGLDFSDFGLRENHPHLVSSLKQGNVFDQIQKLVAAARKFDLVWLDNVLEHVIDPEALIQQCRSLTKENGALVIEVPNDYSLFQNRLLKEAKVNRKYWEAYPDHLSYFSRESLQKLTEANGWEVHKIISDFPIEWYLANENSNYAENKNIGKAAHKARMFIENFLHQNQRSDMSDLIDFYETMCKVGQGRQLIGFFSKK